MPALPISIKDSPQQAPNYNHKDSEYKGATLRNAVIVKNGMESGKCSVDLVFEVKDKDGNTEQLAVAMTSGEIIQMLASTIKGAESAS